MLKKIFLSLLALLVSIEVCYAREPFFTFKKSQPSKRHLKVVIDPGHGGSDPGAISKNGLREKNVNLKVAYETMKLLRSLGVNAIMTRYSDKTVSLDDRVDFINRHKPDFALSIHANSSPSKSVYGFESYIYDKKLRRGKIICKISRIQPFQFIYPIHRNNSPKKAKEVQMAYHIHKKYAQYTGAIDRGIRAAHFYVLKYANVPCMLLEMGYLSNPRESATLANRIYQHSISRGVAEGTALAMYGENKKITELLAKNYNIEYEEEGPSRYQSAKNKKRTFRFPFAVTKGVN